LVSTWRSGPERLGASLWASIWLAIATILFVVGVALIASA